MTASFSDELRAQGGLLAELAERPREPDPAAPPRRAAAGPRVAGRAAEYELLLEMIFEGSRLHYDESELDPDVALLLGDQLYALGLERLAALGDLDAVAELADIISLVAQARAANNPELADAVWDAGATAIGWGFTKTYEQAKARARMEDPGAVDVLRGVAS